MSKKKKGFQKLLYSYAKQIIGIDQDSENTQLKLEVEAKKNRRNWHAV